MMSIVTWARSHRHPLPARCMSGENGVPTDRSMALSSVTCYLYPRESYAFKGIGQPDWSTTVIPVFNGEGNQHDVATYRASSYPSFPKGFPTGLRGGTSLRTRRGEVVRWDLACGE